MSLLDKIYQAQKNINGVAVNTPLVKNVNLSDEFAANIYLKREDLQPVRSYKIRGAYNKIVSLSESDQEKGVVCASAGNHAQGVAYACNKLNISATIFMPVTTPKQKVKQVKLFGKEKVEIVLKGDTFDESFHEANRFCKAQKAIFIHPFDDQEVIAGQGTVALELLKDTQQPIDYLFVPIGGGGLAAGLCLVFQQLSPTTKIIGVEPSGAASMKTSIANKKNTTLNEIDKFVDGAAVKRVGDLTFEICKDGLHDIISVPEGKVCTTILRLYNEEAIVVEPAGALTISALDFYKDKIKEKNVVCIVSGSNNDITRTEEIRERSLLYEGLKHYFIINFPQRPGALKEFVNEVLSPNDDITYFQFSKKNNRESGPAVVGIELKNKKDFIKIDEQLKRRKFNYRYLNDNEDLFTHLIG
ncbi:threonine ammonia-lyase IlvA [Flavobacterium psychrophilum]|uniref:threonine ammonia-lyase IlvA n=1 Tax=Flavobacterium psychrophilum TaxID=96345 RepID=UPI001C8F7C04|nr:threonine ammonia-lyase IlvA [Flavobacterium psychrophilum]EKT4498705.1 threonine ammonia-lyase IlvA [Flavobacterium psychrophilum]ELM3649417.1 threonine ammonia-lyase IlvA [Flavobacterium psychrophilum]ELM3672189.1 threonine ammonia-lyase IlvA [Flavobacterium psychrophilum]ELM3724977.1 threonine ammonia-lyase IlvA [Flavobacterium psychrophilum]ELY1992645.1 threonine ammonia-lyase IlvA [Flavobacterium psychrophilum]